MLKKGIASFTRRNFQVRCDMSPRMSCISAPTRADEPSCPDRSSSMMSIIASRAPVSTKETALERRRESVAVASRPFEQTVANMRRTMRAVMFSDIGLCSRVYFLLCR